MPQTRRFMGNQAHSVRDEAKAFPEFALLDRPAPSFVNFTGGSTGSDCYTCLILDEPDFVEKFSHKRSSLPHDRHACHVGQVTVTISSGVER